MEIRIAYVLHKSELPMSMYITIRGVEKIGVKIMKANILIFNFHWFFLLYILILIFC